MKKMLTSEYSEVYRDFPKLKLGISSVDILPQCLSFLTVCPVKRHSNKLVFKTRNICLMSFRYSPRDSSVYFLLYVKTAYLKRKKKTMFVSDLSLS